MKKIKITYFGTPSFSAEFLEKLLTDREIPIEIKLVVTQSDKPVGRKQILTKTPVKLVAEKYGIKVIDDLKKLQVTSYKLHEIDLAFLFAYGGIIPRNLLELPKYGFLNTHPSLLPKYRGPGPIVYPLILGEKQTGVTLIKLDEEIDHGPIIAQEKIEINPKDKKPELEKKLTELCLKLFKKILLPKLLSMRRSSTRYFTRYRDQNHNQATFTRLLKKDDGYIPFAVLKDAIQGLANDWKPKVIKEYQQKNKNVQITNYKLPITIYNLFRGLYPWPGLWTLIKIKGQQKRLKITDLTINNQQLTINSVQLEGKKEVDFHTFNSAYQIF